MGMLFEVVTIVLVAGILIAPALLYQHVSQAKDATPSKVKDIGRWVLDHFISMSILLLVLSISLYMYARDRNWVKLGLGLFICVVIVLYQAGQLGFIPGSDKLNSGASSVHTAVAEAGTKLPSWGMYILIAVFLAVSLFLIRKIFMRRVMLGGMLLAGGEYDDDDFDSDVEVVMNSFDGGKDDVEVLDDGGEDFGSSPAEEDLDDLSDMEEREMYSRAMGGANKRFNEEIRQMADDMDY